MGSGPLTSFIELEVDNGLSSESSEIVLGRNWFADYREYMISEELLASTRSACEARESDTEVSRILIFILVCYFGRRTLMSLSDATRIPTKI